MKKKLLSLLFISLLFVGVSTVKASTDINDWTVTVEATTGNVGASLTMTVEGEMEEKGHFYYAKFVNEGDEKPILEYDKQYENDQTIYHMDKIKNVNVTSKKISVSDDWYVLEGYEYIYFFDCTIESRTCKTSDEPVKLIKPELPALDQRYNMYYFEKDDGESYFSAFPYFPHYTNENINYEFKMGIINDKELLYSLYKKQDGALEKLLEYAENANDKAYTFTREKVSNITVDKFDVIKGAYYYMYATVKDEKGIYRDLSGVDIAIGHETHLSNDITWSFDDENSNATVEEEKVEKNPSTADTNIALILGALAVCGSLIVIGKKKISAK